MCLLSPTKQVFVPGVAKRNMAAASCYRLHRVAYIDLRYMTITMVTGFSFFIIETPGGSMRMASQSPIEWGYQRVSICRNGADVTCAIYAILKQKPYNFTTGIQLELILSLETLSHTLSGVATPRHTRACAHIKFAGARVKIMWKARVKDQCVIAIFMWT